MLTSLRTLLRGVAKSLGVERAADAALIEEMWPEIVGADAAEHSHPAGLRGGVLVVEAVGGMWAQDLSAQRARFAAEINRRLGARAVREIRVRQVVSVAARPAALPDGPAGPPPDPSPEEVAAVEQGVAEVADPALREAARRAWLRQLMWRKRHVRPPGR